VQPEIVADYFLLLDAAWFEHRIRPALAECWRRRTFAPAASLCTDLLPSLRAYVEKYHVADEGLLVPLVFSGLPFDRAIWRSLVSEVLLFGAAEIPELQACPDTLSCLVASQRLAGELLPRSELALIQQAHVGSRELVFGSAVYRPEHAGYNHAGDVARLIDYLDSLEPERWRAADLAWLPDLPEEDREEELALARDWFPQLVNLFQRAQRNGHVIVHERIY
jgi:hypothetical protein